MRTIAYSTVQALPDGQHWEFRVSGTIDGAFVSEWVDVYAIPEGHGHDHDHEYEQETDTTLLLRLGAIGVALVGSLAVTLETVRFGRLERD